MKAMHRTDGGAAARGAGGDRLQPRGYIPSRLTVIDPDGSHVRPIWPLPNVYQNSEVGTGRQGPLRLGTTFVMGG